MIDRVRFLRSSWTPATVAALAAIVGVVAALSRTTAVFKPSPAAPAAASRTVVRFADSRNGEATGWGAHSAMSDLAPLFLPSDRNARLPPLPLREPGDGTLETQNVKFRFRETDAAVLLNFPPTTLLNGKPLGRIDDLDALAADDSLSIGFGFGRRPAAPIASPPRGGLIEVYAAGSGQLLLLQEIAEAVHPVWPQVWHPLEFLAAIEPGGLVGPLSLTVTSRVDSVDAFFRDYLARNFKLGERMAPGFYRIVVSP